MTINLGDDVQFLCTFPSKFTINPHYEHLSAKTEFGLCYRTTFPSNKSPAKRTSEQVPIRITWSTHRPIRPDFKITVNDTPLHHDSIKVVHTGESQLYAQE